MTVSTSDIFLLRNFQTDGLVEPLSALVIHVMAQLSSIATICQNKLTFHERFSLVIIESFVQQTKILSIFSFVVSRKLEENPSFFPDFPFGKNPNHENRA